jgi:4-alpha-glucanotransferase
MKIWVKNNGYRITDYATYDKFENEIRADGWRVVEDRVDNKTLILENSSNIKPEKWL